MTEYHIKKNAIVFVMMTFVFIIGLSGTTTVKAAEKNEGSNTADIGFYVESKGDIEPPVNTQSASSDHGKTSMKKQLELPQTGEKIENSAFISGGILLAVIGWMLVKRRGGSFHD